MYIVNQCKTQTWLQSQLGSTYTSTIHTTFISCTENLPDQLYLPKHKTRFYFQFGFKCGGHLEFMYKVYNWTVYRWKAMPSQAKSIHSSPIQCLHCWIVTNEIFCGGYSLLFTVVNNCKWDQATLIMTRLMLKSIKFLHMINIHVTLAICFHFKIYLT